MKKAISLFLTLVMAFSLSAVSFAAEETIDYSHSFYIGEVGESCHTIIPYTTRDGTEGFIIVNSTDEIYSGEIVSPNNSGDPVEANQTYDVWFWSPMTSISYKVDTNSSALVSSAYDLDYITVHNITSSSLTTTSYRAHLYITVVYFNIAGSATCYLDFIIRDGCYYIETDM